MRNSSSKLNRGVHAYRSDGYGKSKFRSGPQTKRDKDEQVYHSKKKVDSTFFAELKGKHLQRKHSIYDTLYPWFTKEQLANFPTKKVDLSSAADKSRHDQMVKLVEQMLELHQRLSAARTPQEKTALERQIAATDTQIDRLVYDLYGLTEEEIEIVQHTRR